MSDVNVTVIIPTGKNEKINNINRTIKSVLNNSSMSVEILVLADGWEPDGINTNAKISSSCINIGERKTVNRGFKEAEGDYVLRIDAHCAMSKDWDKILLDQYKKNTISLCILDALDEETWGSLNHRYTFVYVNPSCEEKWWGDYPEGLITCEPTMSLTGCGWFCDKNLFLNKLQFDEDLSKWGCIGPELTAKIERINGSIILNKNVTCLHLFTTNSSGYPVAEVAKSRKQMLSRYARYIYKAAKRFNAPGWENINKDYITNYERNFMYETDVSKKDHIEVKNENGKVIKTVIKIYESVHYKGVEDPDIPEIGRKITKNAKLQKIKIATSNLDNKLNYEIIEGEQAINKWLFENE